MGADRPATASRICALLNQSSSICRSLSGNLEPSVEFVVSSSGFAERVSGPLGFWSRKLPGPCHAASRRVLHRGRPQQAGLGIQLLRGRAAAGIADPRARTSRRFEQYGVNPAFPRAAANSITCEKS
jgi:hypothetical protein